MPWPVNRPVNIDDDARTYRELLKKYMTLVADEEGVTFVSSAKWNQKAGLTNQDLRKLRAIEEELRAEWTRRNAADQAGD